MDNPKPKGRPTAYTEAIGKEICDRLATPETLLSICKDEHIPGRTTVYAWLLSDDEQYKDFQSMYARAKQLQAHTLVDEIIEISDDARYDWVERKGKDGKTDTVFDYEHLQRSRLRVDTRKWFAAKVLPKLYGEKPDESDSGEKPGFNVVQGS